MEGDVRELTAERGAIPFLRAQGRGCKRDWNNPEKAGRTSTKISVALTPRGKGLIVSAFRKHSGQMKRVFSELSPEELRGLEVKLKKVGKRAAALMEES